MCTLEAAGNGSNGWASAILVDLYRVAGPWLQLGVAQLLRGYGEQISRKGERRGRREKTGKGKGSRMTRENLAETKLNKVSSKGTKGYPNKISTISVTFLPKMC